MQPIQITPFQAFCRSLVMVVRAAPMELFSLIMLALIGGAGAPATLFFNKIIIDEVSRLLAKGTIAEPLDFLLQNSLLLRTIGALILLNLLTDSLNTLTNFSFSSLRDRVQGLAQGQVLEKVAKFGDIALFETPQLLNLVQLTEKGIERLQQLSFIIITTLRGLFIFVPAVLLSGSLAWWIPLILLVSATPSVYVELKYCKQSWQVEETQASIVRQMNLYKNVLMGEAYAKELRLFGLQTLLLERWRGWFRGMFRAMQQVRRKGTLVVIFWSVFSGLGVALPYLYVVVGALGGNYTLGDLALYAGLILQVRQSLFLLINNASNLYDAVLGTRPIFELLELKPKLRLRLPFKSNKASRFSDKKSPKTALNKVTEDFLGIQIKNLSFSYPGSDRKVLENLNLKIQPNEMIALVGENGAGKTTLAKLLCRLYDPDRGEIIWNGRNFREFDLEELYSRITVIMQDYAHFPTTIRENVSFGYLPFLQNEPAIREAINRAGIAKIVEHLPQGLETLLGKQLEGGVDLSEGQWQRVALARSLMRLSCAKLLIFDEPTAALDPKTEYEMYQLFRTISSNRTAVVISHRLALSKLADRIIVLENGKIIEMGVHDELMAMGGQYHLMFTRQASSYL